MTEVVAWQNGMGLKACAGPSFAAAQGRLSVWHVLLSDATFTAGAIAFLLAGLRYGLHWHPSAAAYKGAWLDARGVPALPAGFARYLPVAGMITFLLPAAALLVLAASGRGAAGALVFGGYLLAFLPQALMETKLFNRECSTVCLGWGEGEGECDKTRRALRCRGGRPSQARPGHAAAPRLLPSHAGNPLSPAIPFTFGPYRMWQLARALWALGAHVPAAAGAPAWLAPFIAFLLAFWVFDHGVTALQLPWVSWGAGSAGARMQSVLRRRRSTAAPSLHAALARPWLVSTPGPPGSFKCQAAALRTPRPGVQLAAAGGGRQGWGRRRRSGGAAVSGGVADGHRIAAGVALYSSHSSRDQMCNWNE